MRGRRRHYRENILSSYICSTIIINAPRAEIRRAAMKGHQVAQQVSIAGRRYRTCTPTPSADTNDEMPIARHVRPLEILLDDADFSSVISRNKYVD